jgi:hypothetical protein
MRENIFLPKCVERQQAPADGAVHSPQLPLDDGWLWNNIDLAPLAVRAGTSDVR